ncbi:type II toxin-antitoxin system HipA family toxin [Changchengzhania lutea]|uniref:type II toxin-antitoxin system HipA family toxin n=1 Tax=Changchengzhania lutea TaxID=2049305 RepID=UPI00115CA289|nr:type II toxin-antitoxin system HipA family toxin [Changchengzhania lutea]
MGIEIFIWNIRVGALVKTPEGIAFEYDPEFVKTGLGLSPINLPLEGKRIYINEADWKETEGIPGLVYDSLPDKFGNDLLRAYFMDKGLTENDIDVFAKLQYIGTRGMGALEFRPATEIKQTEDIISLEDIEKISMLSTQGKEALKTNVKDKNALLQILHIGTSAGGARAKALIAINKENGTIKSGQLPLGQDYGYYLIKIDGANKTKLEEPSGYGKLEYAYSQMAKDCDIQMTECTLYKELHFLTKRFDRDDSGEKIHVHSLCGLLGLDYNKVGQYSYEHYFMAARRLNLGHDAIEEIYSRMVFNVLVHNCDDHTKNFSFMMNQNGEWSLSPAFDLCYSYDNQNEWVNGHNMRINNKRTNISYEDLMVVGKKFNVKKRKAIFDKIKRVVDNFPEYGSKIKVRQELIDQVEKNRPRIKQLI